MAWGTRPVIPAGAEIVERVDVTPGNWIFRRNAQDRISLPLEIVARVFGKNPVRTAQITRQRPGNRLDRLRTPVYVVQDPLLPAFPFRRSQFDVAVSVIL